jgi:alpha-N-arabinofuranosidase
MIRKSMLAQSLAWSLTAAAALFATQALAQAQSVPPLAIAADRPGPVISRNLFGQFAEQLGNGVDNGIWVGPDSPIPNVRGIRSDVVSALRALKVPNVRWPGGCFADQYDWRDGIGPRASRPVRYNIHWGSPVETNQFGTHEYMDFIEQIGSDAHIVANVGTGTVREAAQWLEYMTTDKSTTLGKERAANGRASPWRIKYFAYGNESYGCGGPMSAETYTERLRIYSNYARNLNPAQSGQMPRFIKGPDPMIRLAVGPAHDQTDYTEAVMAMWQKSSRRDRPFDALSFHYYTPGPKGSMLDKATGFGEADYAAFIRNSYVMNELIKRQSDVMDKYDPGKDVALSIDEWGVWLEAAAGSPDLYLEQQTSLRDAIVAAIHLNIFARHADRVRMANIAQMVNVLQAMVMTDGPKMLLTPTYHIFRMYVPFQDAQFLPVELDAGQYRFGDIAVPRVDAIAARATDGSVRLALTNIDPVRATEFRVAVPGQNPKSADGEVLTAARLDTINTFDEPAAVTPKPVRIRAQGGVMTVRLAPKSVTVLRLID